MTYQVAISPSILLSIFDSLFVLELQDLNRAIFSEHLFCFPALVNTWFRGTSSDDILIRGGWFHLLEGPLGLEGANRKLIASSFHSVRLGFAPKNHHCLFFLPFPSSVPNKDHEVKQIIRRDNIFFIWKLVRLPPATRSRICSWLARSWVWFPPSYFFSGEPAIMKFVCYKFT